LELVFPVADDSARQNRPRRAFAPLLEPFKGFLRDGARECRQHVWDAVVQGGHVRARLRLRLREWFLSLWGFILCFVAHRDLRAKRVVPTHQCVVHVQSINFPPWE
jgi:hypothetical protein